MPALVLDGTGKIEVVPVRPPEARPPGEARIRMRLAGVCNTDLELARGYLGFRGVPGHEFVGDVIEASSPSLQGKRVVGGINCACLACDFCGRGLENHCSRRTVLGIAGRDGAFQDEFLLPERNLVAVPDAIPDEHAVFSEPLAAACRIVEQVDLSPWDRVAVLGDGKLGILCAWVLATRCGDVTLFGRRRGRVPFPVTVTERDAPTADAARAGSDRFDVVVEATGTPSGLEVALALVRPLGRLVLKTTCAQPHHLSLAPVVIDEITITGSRCGDLGDALDLMAEGTLPLQRLIDARVPLADGTAAFARAAEPGALKVLIEGSRAR